MLCPICQFENPLQSKNCGTCGAVLRASADASSAAHPDALPLGTLLAGTYLVEALLGQGGFGITYRCHDQMLDRPVAIKEFFPSGCRRQGTTVLPSRGLTDSDFREARSQFLAEARLLARCHHNGIVSVHTAFETNETAYMVMELLHGQSLAQLIDARGGRLPEDEAVGTIERTGQALQFVHDQDLLHRDIKPENIIVCDDGRVMLIDFGTAREYSKGQSQGHTIVVTPGYAPLEQYARQAKRGAFTDVYGLAATLYHLLTGHVPPAASDRAMGVSLRPVRQENARISASVARAVEAGLQMEIAKRPQSVHEFLDLLKAPIEEEEFDDSESYDSEYRDSDAVDALNVRLVDEGIPLLRPSSAQPMALHADPPQSSQDLQEWLDSIQNAVTPAISLTPYVFSQQRAPSLSSAPKAMVPTSPGVPVGGVLHKNTSKSGSPDFGLWLVVAFFILIFASVLLASRNTTPTSAPVYTTTTITNSQFVPPPPVSRPAPRLIPQVAPADTSPVILPVSIETLPGSVITRTDNNSLPVYSFMKDMATFSLDGKLLAYIDSLAIIRVWDRKERRVLQSLPSDNKYPAAGLLFSRDNETIVVTYQGEGKQKTNNEIRAWNLRTGQLQATLSLDPEKEWIWPQAALSDGQIIVLKGALWTSQHRKPPSSVFLWNAHNGKQSTLPIQNSAELERVVVSPDGREIVTGDRKGRIGWQEARTGAQTAERITSMTYGDFQKSPLFAQNTPNTFQAIPAGVSLSDPLRVDALQFSSNGAWLASRNEAQMRVFNFKGQETGSLAIGHSPLFAVSPDGKTLVEGGGWDRPETARIWDISQKQSTRLAGSAGRLESLTFSPDGQQIWGVSNDGGSTKLIIWSAKAQPVSVFGNPKVSTFPSTATGIFIPVDFSQSNQFMAVPGFSAIEIRQQDGKLVKTLNGNFNALKPMKISFDGQFLAIQDWNGALQLWNVQTEKLMTQLEASKVVTRLGATSTNSSLRARSKPMAFSPDSELFAYRRSDDNFQGVELWSLKNTPRRLASIAQKETVTALTFSPDSRSLLWGDGKGGLTWFDVATQHIQTPIKTDDTIVGIAFTHRNLVVLARTTTKFYQLPTKPLTPRQSFQEVAQANIPILWDRSGRTEKYWCVSEDGQLLATRDRRNTIRVWQLPTGAQLQTLSGDDFEFSQLRSLAFSSDGNHLTSLMQRFSSEQMLLKTWSRPKTQ